MFTNNFRKLLFKFVFGATSTFKDTPSDTYSNLPTIITTSGANRSFTNMSSSGYIRESWYSIVNSLGTINTSSTNGRGFIILGTGTTAPTADDYCLESQITENLSCDSVSVSRATTTKTYTATFSNSGTSDMVVTEIGYVSRITHNYNFGDYYWDDFLMDRTVLETPITIPAGESRTVTYELSF